MTPHDTPFARVQAHWVYGGLVAALLMAALTPLFAEGWTTAETLIFLTLPAYMVHQFEEFDDNRFLAFYRRYDATGRDPLGMTDVFVVNVIVVWGGMAATLWAMHRVDAGWGVIAAYLVLINAAVHVGAGLALRMANPGLWTALVLFLPLGTWSLVTLWPVTTPAQHVTAMALVVGGHLAILLRVRQRIRA